MRSAGNFSPEWGYLAPTPSFARTARIVLVATAIGATAGAGVVLTLTDRPTEPQRTPIAAHAIVTSLHVTVPSVAPAAAAVAPNAMTAPATVAAAPPAPIKSDAAAPAASAVAPTALAPAASANADAGAAAPATGGSAEPPAVAEAAPSDPADNPGIIAPEATPQKKVKARHAGSGKAFPGIGSLLRRLFVAHAGRSNYPN
jgi:hypothetical protein